MQRLPLTASVFTFFAMAGVGLYLGHSPLVVAIRAGIGAVIAYGATALALKFSVDVMVKAVLSSAPPPKAEGEEEDEESERETQA